MVFAVAGELKSKPLPSTMAPIASTIVPLSNSNESCTPTSTPNSSSEFRSTSAIKTFTFTNGGRRSRRSITAMTSGRYCGVALMIRLLLTTSATTSTSPSAKATLGFVRGSSPFRSLRASNQASSACWTSRTGELLRRWTTV